MTADQLAQLSVLFSAVSAAGIIVAAWQLFVTHRQAVTTFEDTIAREYRELQTPNRRNARGGAF